MKTLATILIVISSFLVGCTTAVTPEKAANVDLQKTGLVLATISRSGEAEDVKKVLIEFYLRPYDGEGNPLKELVINSWEPMWLIEVPLGRYEITDWFLSAGTMRRESAEKGFEFEVRPGQITYIGHFDVAVARAKNFFGLRVIPEAIPALRDDYERTLVAFRKQYPALADKKVHNVAPQRFIWGATDSKTIPVNIPVPIIK
jgi:hypothetical protein